MEVGAGVLLMLLGLVLNYDPPDLCFLSDWDYNQVTPGLAAVRFYFVFLFHGTGKSFH
jgi:hypothetical protein